MPAPLIFSALCTLSMLGQATFSAPCTFRDMPAPGMNNRFSVELHTYLPVPAQTRQADYVSVSSDLSGSMRISSVLFGSVSIQPDLPAFQTMFMQLSREIRPQNVTVRVQPGRIFVLIDEPCEDFDGESASVAWQTRFARSHEYRAR